MSVVIENDYGKFEADTEREALKLSRAAKRQRQKQERIDTANRAAARTEAAVNGYRIYLYLAEHDSGPVGWSLSSEGDKHFPPAKWDEDNIYRLYEFEGEAGYASISLYQSSRFSTKPIGFLTNAAGYDIAVWLQDGEKVEAHAIGIAGGLVTLARLPGVTMDKFRRFRQSVSEWRENS